MKDYFVPAEQARCEITVINSRFIASLSPAPTLEAARDFIAQIRREFADASHNVPAYLVGGGATVTAYCSDDGEPSGTAGRPILAVLNGSGFGDVALVVTRYFGGTKLGTGGLVRAYTEAAQAVLAIARRARYIAGYTALLVLPYNGFERVRLLVLAHGGEILEQDFAADVTLTLRFPLTGYEPFCAAVRDLSAGAWQPEIMETGEWLQAVD
ncbi:MAG: YigZ family protein [Anaerolineales bacterium]